MMKENFRLLAGISPSLVVAFFVVLSIFFSPSCSEDDGDDTVGPADTAMEGDRMADEPVKPVDKPVDPMLDEVKDQINPVRADGIFSLSGNEAAIAVAATEIADAIGRFYVRNETDQNIRLKWSVEDLDNRWNFYVCDPLVCHGPGVVEGDFELAETVEDDALNAIKFTLLPLDEGNPLFVGAGSFMMRVSDPDSDFYQDVTIQLNIRESGRLASR